MLTQTAELSNPMQGFNVPTAPVAPKKVSIEIDEQPEVKPRNTINRDAPRYVILFGDYMLPTKKRDMQIFDGIHLGGTWFDVGQVPALWRTQGFIFRGKITPLLKKSFKMGADEREVAENKGDQAVIVDANGETNIPGHFRTVFPYDSLQSVQALGRISGIVEIEELHKVDYNSGIIQEIQDFIIPGWNDILAGAKPFPFVLNDAIALIESRKRATSETLIRAICDRYLESADVFRVWANSEIDRNKMGYDKGVNEQGHRQPITELAQMLAEQIGRRIDTTQPIVVQAGAPQTAPADRDLEERRIAAMEEANRLKRLELEGGAPLDRNTATSVAQIGQTAVPPKTATEIEINPVKCSEISARSGEPCKNDALAGSTRCGKHPVKDSE